MKRPMTMSQRVCSHPQFVLKNVWFVAVGDVLDDNSRASLKSCKIGFYEVSPPGEDICHSGLVLGAVYAALNSRLLEEVLDVEYHEDFSS